MVRTVNLKLPTFINNYSLLLIAEVHHAPATAAATSSEEYILVRQRLPKMPLEAAMLIIDNSEYMRNGDYHTRFEIQTDTANIVFQTIIDSNAERTTVA